MAISGFDWIKMAAPYIAGSWIANLWQGLVLAFGVWLCLKMLPRVSASTRFAVWIITFFTITVLPFLRMVPLPVAHGPVAQAFQVVPHASIQLDIRWAMGITGVWIAAIVVQAIRLILDLLRLSDVRKSATPIPLEEMSSDLQELLKSTGRKVQLHLSDMIDTPSAIGFFRPAVIIPSWLWKEFSPAQLRQVLVHELAHLRRYDDWTNLLQKFVRTLLPIHPALYWVERRLCFEREIACDDAVLGAEVAPRDYATCLTTLAGRKLAQRSAVLAPGAIEKQSDLSRRVYSLLSRTRNSSLLVARGVAAGFLFATLGGAVAFTQCPQWISFSSPVKRQAPVWSADMASKPEFQLATLRTTSASAPVAQAHIAKARPAVMSHRVPRQRRPVMTATLPAVQKNVVTPATDRNSQVWIVLSVWQTMSDVQIHQTALIFTENSSTSAKSAAQVRQSWFILQI